MTSSPDDATPGDTAPGVIARGERSVAVREARGAVIKTGDEVHLPWRPRRPDTVDPPARLSNLPRQPVRVFVGRDAAVAELARAAGSGRAAVVTQVVVGLGGVGKSELALQYAAGWAGRGPVWWVPAESAEQVDAGLAGLTRAVEPGWPAEVTAADAAAWAVGWLQSHPGWLLVLDNVERRQDVDGLLGRLAGSGQVIITTRRDIGWEATTEPVRLSLLAPAAAVVLLARRTGRNEPDAAAGIAVELGCLPLALDQAAAYITQQHTSLADYLELLRQRPADMFAATAEGGPAERTVARVWEVTLAAVAEASPLAVAVLGVLSCMDPDGLPRYVLAGMAADPLAVDAALGVLASYSMVGLDRDTVGVHRLVQAVVRHQAGDDALTGYRDGAAELLAAVAPPDDPHSNIGGWPTWRQLTPHVQAVAAVDCAAPAGERIGALLNQAGAFRHSQGEYAAAANLFHEALAVATAVFGPDHPTVAAALANLASSYRDLGQATDAVPLETRALEITEAVLGPNHPTVATLLGNLAGSYRELGQAADAVPLETRALQIAEAAHGPNHPNVAAALGNLAASYRELGWPTDAVSLETRALQIAEAAHGPNHPNIANRLNNLAVSYSALGRATDAVPLETRALQIAEATLGPNHPNVAVALGNLAASYRELGQAAHAVPLLERALAITEAALGPNHPDVATRLNNLAANYRELGRAADAVPLLERALQITEAALGPDHPNLATWLGNLAARYWELGRAADMVPLLERALAIAEAALGLNHPDVATWLANLAASYHAVGRAADAVPLVDRAVNVASRTLGPGHSTTRALGEFQRGLAASVGL